MRISAHFLRGDVKFFPCAPAVGASPSARRGEKRRSVFWKGGFFSEKWRGKAKNRGLFAWTCPKGARTWRCGATNGGRRADGRLRRPRTLGVDGRRGALSDRLSLLYNVSCRAKAFCRCASSNEKPPPPTKRSAVGALLWGCVGTEGAGFSVCRRAYRLFSWGCGRRPVLFRLSVRAFRPVRRQSERLPREPAPPSPGGRSGS